MNDFQSFFSDYVYLMNDFQNESYTFHRCLLPSFGSFGQVVSEEKILKISQSETRIACGSMFVNGSGQNEQYL
jgi:hypothetical protein